MKKSIAVLKSYFKTGDKPTQQQFYDFLESFLHLDSYILASQVSGLEEALTTLEELGISDVAGLQTALNDLNSAINTLQISDVSGLQSVLNALAVVNIGDIQGLQEVLDSLATRSIENIIGLNDELNNKVDKIDGYGLSENDFSNYYVGLITAIQNAVTALTYESIVSESTIIRTLSLTDVNKRIVFSNANPITLTVPLDASVAWYTGTKIKGTVQGNGSVTISGAGITFIGNTLTFPKGESFILTNTALNTWTVEGNAPASGAKTPYTVYIDTVNGSDVTGRIEDASFPFKTDAGAFSALPANNGNPWNFVFICNNVTRNLIFPTQRKIRFICNNTGTFNLNNWTGNAVSVPEIYFEAPACDIIATINAQTSLLPVMPVYINVNNINITNTNVGGGNTYINSSVKSFIFANNLTCVINGAGSLFTEGTFLFKKVTTNRLVCLSSAEATIPELVLAGSGANFFGNSYPINKFKTKSITGTGVFEISGLFDITDLATSANIDIVSYGVLTGFLSSNYLGILRLGFQASNVTVMNFHGKLSSWTIDNSPANNLKIHDSTIFLDQFLYRTLGFSGTRTWDFKNVEIIQTTAGPLVNSPNANALTVIRKTGFIKTTGTFDAQTTFIDRTPNSY